MPYQRKLADLCGSELSRARKLAGLCGSELSAAQMGNLLPSVSLDNWEHKANLNFPWRTRDPHKWIRGAAPYADDGSPKLSLPPSLSLSLSTSRTPTSGHAALQCHTPMMAAPSAPSLSLSLSETSHSTVPRVL